MALAGALATVADGAVGIAVAGSSEGAAPVPSGGASAWVAAGGGGATLTSSGREPCMDRITAPTSARATTGNAASFRCGRRAVALDDQSRVLFVSPERARQTLVHALTLLER